MHLRAALPLTLAASASAVLLCAVTTASCSGSSSGGGAGTGNDASASSSGGSSGSGSSGASSSGGTSSGGGSSSGSASSSGSSSGTPGDGGPTCPQVPCTGGDTCCADLTTDVPVCTSTCEADDTVECLGPSTCGSSTPDCCATDVLDGMDAGESFPHCYTKSLTTKCVAKCVSNIQLSCNATETLHVCQQAADCSDDTANPNCCVVAGYHVCVSTILMKLGSLSCL